MQAVTEEMCEPEPMTAADGFKIDYRGALKKGSAGFSDDGDRTNDEARTREYENTGKFERL